MYFPMRRMNENLTLIRSQNHFKQTTTKVQAFLSRKPRGRLSSGDRAVLYDGVKEEGAFMFVAEWRKSAPVKILLLDEGFAG
jgi:hypothetical protein